jgi:streptogramin lyase
MKTKSEKILGSGIFHPGARPMSIHIDDQGNEWLCDKSIQSSDFAAQGCWRTDSMAFNRND